MESFASRLPLLSGVFVLSPCEDLQPKKEKNHKNYDKIKVFIAHYGLNFIYPALLIHHIPAELSALVFWVYLSKKFSLFLPWLSHLCISCGGSFNRIQWMAIG
ncbi:MAG TPA: hypothetical protein ENJ82_11690 [Bacteroidetes bacterium]|nr:hypothetical protein [Bacteroidota bacterium]